MIICLLSVFLALFRRLLVEELIYLSCGLRINSGNIRKVGERRPLDGFHSAKMMQQGPLSRGPDAGDFLESGLANVFLAPRAVGADGEAVSLVTQPLDEIQQRIARRQLEGRAARHKEGLTT